MPDPAANEPTHTNALIDETSPYLLQHAHNPVDWMPWGEAAFERARREDKPIFLSVGYSTCYWCHVMERQVFENAELAAAVNERCVCIKVDREQRPDVDEIYMTATQLITRRGGWPMSVFLTPPASEDSDPKTKGYGLKPFWAGTYLPPEPMQGMPSFRQVIDGIADAWANKRQEVLDQAEQIAQAVREHTTGSFEAGPISAQLVQDAANQLLHTYDPENAGFGGAPKFPQPTNLQLLLAIYQNNRVDEIWETIAHTLDRMARGGMYDQVGGGFHRYSTDAQWLVPHFEKMLYDNGQLLETYADAHAYSQADHEKAFCERTLRETADYAIREMTDATGSFWSAQDAEVNASEGQNYVWTEDEIREAIGGKEGGGDDGLAELALKMYGVDRGSNFRDPHDLHGKPVNVLFLPDPLEDLVDHPQAGGSFDSLLEKQAEINDRLKAVRDRRDQPATDDKVLAGWNGLMIAGLAKTAHVLGDAKYLDVARAAADAVLQHMREADGQLLRTMRGGVAAIPAFLEDYALLTHGLVELHRLAPDAGYLEPARELIDQAIDRFATGDGGYFDTRADQSDLFVRVRSATDGAMPGGNSVMAHNLIDLYEITEERAYLERAASDLRSFASMLSQMPLGAVHMVHAALRLLEIDPDLAGDQTAPMARNDDPQRDDTVDVAMQPAELGVVTEPIGVYLELAIAEGYHITAEDLAVDQDLQPLTIESATPDQYEIQVTYPEPITRWLELADRELAVHEGTIRVGVRIVPRGVPSDPPRLRVSYQACSDRACQAPKTLELPPS